MQKLHIEKHIQLMETGNLLWIIFTSVIIVRQLTLNIVKFTQMIISIIDSRRIEMHLKCIIIFENKKRRYFIANIRSASFQLSEASFLTFQYAKNSQQGY